MEFMLAMLVLSRQSPSSQSLPFAEITQEKPANHVLYSGIFAPGQETVEPLPTQKAPDQESVFKRNQQTTETALSSPRQPRRQKPSVPKKDAESVKCVAVHDGDTITVRLDK